MPANTGSVSPTAATVASIEHFVTMITEATAPLTGGDYFRTLVARLARSLGVEVALVTECLDYPENHVRTLALWHGSDFSEDITFDLVGTPCQEVINGGEFCFYPEGMSRLFPEWASEEGGVESFIGIPVFAPSDGRTVGHIAVYDQGRMDGDRIVESMFRIIAARVGAEIERMQAEQALRDSEARARQHLSQLAHVSRLGALGEMASALAHEINQPLAMLTTYGQTCLHLLERPDPDLAAVRNALEKSLEGADRAKEVVKRLRAYVSRGDIKTRVIPVQRLLDDCLVLLQTETRHHQVELVMHLSTELPPIRVDTVLIQQVLLNLVRNGVDAINHSEGTRRRIDLSVSADADQQVLFEIGDSGTGIDEAMRSRLFEPFASSRQDGLGIGLSLCCSILEAHGGRLWLADTSASGSRFCFSLAAECEDASQDSARKRGRQTMVG
ncbi:MAG: sensor histidine kinase [Wenzhouxiangella sp.]